MDETHAPLEAKGLGFAFSLLKCKCSSKDHIRTGVWCKNCFNSPKRGIRGPNAVAESLSWWPDLRKEEDLFDTSSPRVLALAEGSLISLAAKGQVLCRLLWHHLGKDPSVKATAELSEAEGECGQKQQEGLEIGCRGFRSSQDTSWAGAPFSFSSCSPGRQPGCAQSESGCLRQHRRLLLSWELRGAEFAVTDHLASPALGGGCCVSSGKIWAGFHRLFDFK